MTYFVSVHQVERHRAILLSDVAQIAGGVLDVTSFRRSRELETIAVSLKGLAYPLEEENLPDIATSHIVTIVKVAQSRENKKRCKRFLFAFYIVFFIPTFSYFHFITPVSSTARRIKAKLIISFTFT